MVLCLGTRDSVAPLAFGRCPFCLEFLWLQGLPQVVAVAVAVVRAAAAAVLGERKSMARTVLLHVQIVTR